MTDDVRGRAGWMIRALRPVPRGGTILCFHGIRTGSGTDGGGIHVGASLLSEALELATTLGTVVPLRDLVTRLDEGRSIAGLVVITFDDACLSVASHVAPILRRTGSHATVFAVRDASISGTPYWWDRLYRCGPHLEADEWRPLFRALDLPGTVTLGEIRLGLVRDTIVARFKGALPGAVSDILAAVEKRKAFVQPYDRAMNSQELVALASDPHFAIGVHTASHRVLSLLSDAEIEGEITTCHDWLRELLGAPLPMLAIPFGLHDRRTVRLARESGMEAVLRIAPRNVGAGAQAVGLPRFSMSERRRGWKLGAALLGVYDIASSIGLKSGPGDPQLPEVRA